MATQEQIEMILELLKRAPPSEQFRNIDKNTAGTRAILRFLNETDGTLTAGMISEHMNVSTARVAVLLKKMAAKGLIEKESDPADARRVVVRLSEHGMRTAERVRESIYAQVGAMIDKVGVEKMREFAAISYELQSAIKATKIDFGF